MSLLILDPEQNQFFDDNGYLLLKGFYSPAEMEQMRCELHRLVTEIEHRPKNVKYSFMDAPEGYAPDPFNPHNIVGMMDQTLASDYWFDQFTEPRIVSVMVDLLGPDLDFHNGKIRNKPPGFVCTQSWHQDWPYERHTEPDLAAVITYLDPSAFEAGATEVLPGSHLKGEYPHPRKQPHHPRRAHPRRRMRRLGSRAGRRGDHSRSRRPPRRPQLHPAHPPRHHQRVQNRGHHRPMGQFLRLCRLASGPEWPASDAARLPGVMRPQRAPRLDIVINPYY